MKWSKRGFIVILIILSISLVHSWIAGRKLSNRIKDSRLKLCAEQNANNCDLVEFYHNECFKRSYRTQLRVRQFHSDEYESCLNTKIKQHIESQ